MSQTDKKILFHVFVVADKTLRGAGIHDNIVCFYCLKDWVREFLCLSFVQSETLFLHLHVL